MKSDLTARIFSLHQNILSELGHTLKPGACVLDFGCGAGNMVEEYASAGYDAFGCDIRLRTNSDRVRLIDKDTPVLPFADNTFDFVYSDQVLEHAQDHAWTFSEIERVMKPGGISLHVFPSKLRPNESHIFVPLAGVIQYRWWLMLWAALGVRNSFQKGKSISEVVDMNSKYLRVGTNYRSRVQIEEAARSHFKTLVFAEKHMIKHGYGHAHRLYSLLKLFPVIASLYSTFYSRVIFLAK
jgi:SAM-dependent methyltransferase